jgi:hypothetical protein
VERRGGHPVVCVARGSHASYLRAGTRDRLWRDPNDEADGRGRVTRLRLVPVSAGDPPWMSWPGRWGGARRRGWIPGQQDSPRGPAFQPDGRWSDLDGWAKKARDSRPTATGSTKCDTPETALGAGAGVGAAGLAGAALALARRRKLKGSYPLEGG